MPETEELRWRHCIDPPRPEGLNVTQMNNEVSKTCTFCREIAQNSNDAPICDDLSDPSNPRRSKPVSMVFDLLKVPVDQFPDYQNYRKTVEDCINASMEYKNNKVPLKVFQKMKSILDSKSIDVMRVSDFNTRGLEGFCTKNQLASWNRLTVNAGIGDKREDAAGSKGVGKNSFYEMSYLRTLFFQTLNEAGEKAFVGRCSFIPYEKGETLVDSVGFYGRDALGYRPIVNESDFPPFATDRKVSGTDVFIFGYIDAVDGWQYPILSALAKGFFVSILKNEFEATVGGIKLDKDTIDPIIRQLLTRAETSDDKELESLPEVIRAFREGRRFEFEDYDFLLLKSEGRGRIITTKDSTGMTISPYFTQGRCSGVVIAKGEFAKKISKCENPTHTQWVPSNSSESEIKEWAETAIKTLRARLNQSISVLVKEDLADSADAAGLGKVLSIETGDNGAEKPIPSVFGNVVISKISRPKHRSKDPEGNGPKTASGVRDDSGDGPDYPHKKKKRKSKSGTRMVPGTNGAPTVFNNSNSPISNVRTVIEADGTYAVFMDAKRNAKVSIVLRQVYENGTAGPRLPVNGAVFFDGSGIECSDDYVIGPFEVYEFVRNKIRVRTSYPVRCSVEVEVVR